MTEEKFTIEYFKYILDNNRDIQLWHGDTRYKAKSITEVLYPLVKPIWTKQCRYCIKQYVVRTNAVIFLIRIFPDEKHFEDEIDAVKHLILEWRNKNE